MSGPDYTHWHGMYEVAKHFYFKFIPELMKLAAEHNMTDKYKAEVDKLLAKPEHAWYQEGFGSDVMKAIKTEREERYKQ